MEEEEVEPASKPCSPRAAEGGMVPEMGSDSETTDAPAAPLGGPKPVIRLQYLRALDNPGAG